MADRILVGLIGANIMKSLSPALHQDQFRAAGLDGYYHLMDTDRLAGRRFEHVFEAARTAGFAGLNITYPYKQSVLALLDDVATDARQIGAVNTVTFARDGRAVGNNTDRSGFRRSMEEGLGPNAVNGRRVAQVGAGGAGRAVAFALLDLGAAHVMLHDTDAARARATVVDLGLAFGADCASVAADLPAAVAAADGIVNATPVGMLGIPGNPVPMDAVRADQFVADVIYTPIETALIAAARRRGCRVVTGGGMCVHQAAESYRHFTGRAADVARMQHTFDRALAARDAALAAAPAL